MKRILVVQTAYLGDAILSQPLWRAAKDFWPDAEVDVLVQPQWASLFAADSSVHEVLAFDKRNAAKGALGLLRMARQLRKKGYDLAFCPHPSFRSALLLLLAGIPQRVGFSDSAGAMFFTQKVFRDKVAHEVDRVLSLPAALGYRPADDRRMPRLRLTPTETAAAENKLNELGLASGVKFVCAHPGSVWATKRWVPEGFAAVLSNLADRGFQPVVLGGKADIVEANMVQDRCRTMPLNLAGKLSLTELAYVLSRAVLLVTNDSGPMHIAGAFGTPVVAVFGSTVPALGYAPVGSPSRIVEKNMPCRPCGPHGYRRCPLGHLHCMKHIAPADVTAAALSLLSATE